MELWEIKAEALRIMFADSDISYTKADFTSGKIAANPNTNDKVRRMTDSIRRAIDIFYQFRGTPTLRAKTTLESVDNPLGAKLLTTNITNLGFPTRIDIVRDLDNNILGEENVDFVFDEIEKTIWLYGYDMSKVVDVIQFIVYYKVFGGNIPLVVDEINYNLDTIHIPEDIQRHIPYYIKGELFEEDEHDTANNARMIFMQYITTIPRKQFSKVQTKVKSHYPRG